MLRVFCLFVCSFVCLLFVCLFFVVVFCCCCCWRGSFLGPEFTRLGHKRQDLWSPCDGMHVCSDWTSAEHSHSKEF